MCERYAREEFAAFGKIMLKQGFGFAHELFLSRKMYTKMAQNIQGRYNFSAYLYLVQNKTWGDILPTRNNLYHMLS